MSEVPSEATQTESQESAADDKPGTLRFILIFMAIVLAYPLSIGPVARGYRGRPPEFVNTLYTPLWALCDRSRVATDTLIWYLGLWGVHYHS